MCINMLVLEGKGRQIYQLTSLFCEGARLTDMEASLGGNMTFILLNSCIQHPKKLVCGCAIFELNFMCVG